MDLGTLISGLDPALQVRVIGDPSGVRVCDLTEDSRTAVPGSLFVARAGLKVDGRTHARAAADCGAVAILTDSEGLDLPTHRTPVVLVTDRVSEAAAAMAERFYGDPSSKLAVVGITGTNGKTSVATMTRAVLQACGVRCGLIGTVEIDDGREVAPAAMTTPPAVELSRTLATMVESGCEAACIEVSSHALDQHRADGVRFAAGVFTNITGDHLDYHKTFEAYLGAKRRLFDLLPEGAARVVNADDPNAESFGGSSLRRCTMGDGVWSVSIADEDLLGMTLAIETPMGPLSGRVPVIGAYNAMNALEAVAAADAVLAGRGADESQRLALLSDAIGSIRTPRGRLECVSGEGDAVRVFVDFAHTDDALGRVLGSVRSLMADESELWVVFGAGGERDKEKRPRMGKAAASNADRVVVTSDNPRGEVPGRIADEILAGIEDRSGVMVDIDRAHAIRRAVMESPPGAVIIIAGKGHETTQTSCDALGSPVTRRFSDHEQAAEALRERRLRIGPGAPDGSTVGAGGA